MDNTQNVPLPPGYTADQIVGGGQSQPSQSQPSAGGGSNTPPPPPGYSADQIVGGSSGGDSSVPNSDEIQSNDDDSLLTKAGKFGAGALEGVGEGVFGTLAGATDFLGGKGHAVSNELHHLAGDDNSEHGTAQNIGQGLETIGEFIMGDAAFKGLSMADRLTKTAKLMKLLESSPRLARALSLGINVGKAGVELSPEERQLLQQYPRLARLAGVGLDSIRAGAVQGTQTAIKTGGDLKQAAKDAAGMAVGSAAIGGPLGELGAKMTKAADTANALRETAMKGSTAQEVSDKLGKTIEDAVQPHIDKAQAALDDANNKIAGASSLAEEIGKDSLDKEQIANKAQAAARAAHDKMNAAYAKGIEDVKNGLDGVTLNYKNSGLQGTAEDIIGAAPKEGEGKVKDIRDVGKIANPVSDKARAMLEGYRDFAGGEGEEPYQLKAEDLIDVAKDLKEKIRNLGYTGNDMADREAYFKLLDAVHGDLESMAEQGGKPELFEKIKATNQAYKDSLAKYKLPSVQGMLNGKNENAILNYIQGKGSIGDVKDIREFLGDKTYGDLVSDALGNIARNSKDASTGKFDFNTFFKNMNKIPDDLRHEMIQNHPMGGALENALNQVKDLNAREVIPNSEMTIKNANKLIAELVGNGNTDRLLNNPEKVRDIAHLVGPEAMGEIGKSILSNKLLEATTGLDKAGNIKYDSVHVDKVMDFLHSLKDSPEVVQALFKPTAETTEAYNKLATQVRDTQFFKNLVKYGVVAPTGVGLGAKVGSWFGHGVLGGLLVGGGEVRMKAGRDILERIANNPRTWNIIKNLGNPDRVVPGAKLVGRYAAGRATNALANALNGTDSQLGK